MSVLMTTLATKIVVGVLAGGIAVTGAAATYASTLPGPWQETANDTVATAPTTLTKVDETPATDVDTDTDADDTDSSTTPKSTPVGPDATGPAAHGLCNAYAHGGLSSHSTAYAALVKASGDESGIDGYCATIEVPGESKGDDSSTEDDTKKDDTENDDTDKDNTDKDNKSAQKADHVSGKSGKKHNK